jgi:acetyl-CoA acyltransferase
MRERYWVWLNSYFYKEISMREKQEAVIVAYGRSPIARGRKGSLANIHPVTFGAETLKGVLAKVPMLDPKKIDDVIVACSTTQGAQCGNFGKNVVIRAGLPDEVPAMTVNRFCSSGLQAIALAVGQIESGMADVIVAGGVESMSQVPVFWDKADRDHELETLRPGAYMEMGFTAENVATQYKITRKEMDQMALESHTKAAAARKTGAFINEIIPINVIGPDGSKITLTNDEGIRENSTIEILAQIKPAFKEDGVVTAATSSQVSDGAAFVVIMSAYKAKILGCKPIARMVGFTVAGVPCEIMGIGPIKAVPKVMKQTGLSIADMDVIELNEAFAAQAIPCISKLKLPKNKVNPRGGALALGHPLGATGTILLCKALSYLTDTKGKYALITMCIGGGQGAAGIFELLG